MTPVLRRAASRERDKGTTFLQILLINGLVHNHLTYNKDMLRLDDAMTHVFDELRNRSNKDWMSDLRNGPSSEKGRMKLKLLLLPLLVLVLVLLPLILSRSLWYYASCRLCEQGSSVLFRSQMQG